MKLLIKNTWFIFLVLFAGCADRETDFVTDGPVNPPHSELKGNVSGRISKSAIPYYVDENLTVNIADTLIIEPGVEIYFSQGKGLIVYGRLFIEGTKEAPVTFSSSGTEWGGIKIISSDTSYIKFAYITQTRNIIESSPFLSGITIVSSKVSITNTVFSNNQALNGGGVYSDSSDIFVSNCIFRNNSGSYYGGALLATASSCRILNNTFYKNRTDNFGGAAALLNTLPSVIENNIFYLNIGRSGNPAIASSEKDLPLITDLYNFFQWNGNPNFISENDLHIFENSPCKDTGNPDPEFNDFDGSRNDPGAYGGKLGNW